VWEGGAWFACWPARPAGGFNIELPGCHRAAPLGCTAGQCFAADLTRRLMQNTCVVCWLRPTLDPTPPAVKVPLPFHPLTWGSPLLWALCRRRLVLWPMCWRRFLVPISVVVRCYAWFWCRQKVKSWMASQDNDSQHSSHRSRGSDVTLYCSGEKWPPLLRDELMQCVKIFIFFIPLSEDFPNGTF